MTFRENFKLIEIHLGTRVLFVGPDQVEQYELEGWVVAGESDAHKKEE